jgi:hypothetical protein
LDKKKEAEESEKAQTHRASRTCSLYNAVKLAIGLLKSGVGVEKVTWISRMRFSRSMLEESIRPCSVGFSSSEAC